MRKFIIPIVICCTCTIICVITIIFLFFFYPQTTERMQNAALLVDIIISIATVCSTISAFIIAIKSPEWNKDANKTELNLDIQNKFPYRNRTYVKELHTFIRDVWGEDCDNPLISKQVREEREFTYETLFYRFKIANNTNNLALNVQVYMEHLRKKGSVEDLDNFLPMFLKWSYNQKLQSDKIIKGMGRYCDFFHICNGKEYLQFDCEDNMSTNNTINNIIDKSGVYEVIILLAAENSENLKRYLITFAYHKDWSDDPEKIISDIQAVQI